MILKVGLNRNAKKANKPAAAPNVFDQLKPKDEPQHTVASQIAAQSERQKQKAEQEKLKLLAEDPNVFSYDDVYDSMLEKKRGQIASKLSADAERKPKYFDSVAKRVEERTREQAVIYQRNIVKERIAEDAKFSQTEAFVTSSYKQQMIKDKAWQTQQDLIDRRNKGPTVAGMAGGFLSHLLNEPPASSAAVEPEPDSSKPSTHVKTERSVSVDKHEVANVDEIKVKKEVAEPKPEKVSGSSAQPESAASSVVGIKRARNPEPAEVDDNHEDSAHDHVAATPVSEPAPPRPSKEELAAAARERYLKRKAQKQNSTAAP